MQRRTVHAWYVALLEFNEMSLGIGDGPPETGDVRPVVEAALRVQLDRAVVLEVDRLLSSRRTVSVILVTEHAASPLRGKVEKKKGREDSLIVKSTFSASPCRSNFGESSSRSQTRI